MISIQKIRFFSVFLFVFSSLVLSSYASRPKMPSLKEKMPYSIAHRGCHIKNLIPENSPKGVEYARKYGFRAIECDAHFTKDSVIVIMHDATINRTMRLRDGYAEIPDPVRYADLTYKELCDRYVMASADPKLRTCIPTLEEELWECKRQGIVPMLHSDVYEAYEMAQRIMGDKWIAFDGNYKAVKRARELGNCLILWDPNRLSAEEIIFHLREIGGSCGISTMKPDLLTADFCHKLTSQGFLVQSSIFPTPYEMLVVQNGASIILSDFCLFDYCKQGRKNGMYKKTNLELQEGDSVLWEVPYADDASIQLEMEFDGRVELVVDGQRKYELNGEIGQKWRNGWRHHGEQKPSVLVRALTSVSIKKLRIESRKY